MLIAARILTGVAAGMAFPTTLALITALWSQGPQRTRAIALWSSVSGGAAILGPVIAGALLEEFWWGSVFLIAVIPAAAALPLVLWCVPAKAEESTDPIDHLGGVLSVAMIGLLVLGVGTITSPGMSGSALVMMIVAAALIVAFFLWQRRARYPLFTPRYATRRFFWVPATAGMIVFGAMMGSMFIGQQFLQNVLSYSTFSAGLAVLPAAIGMIAAAPISARLVIKRGSRLTMLVGFGCILPGFVVMLLAWREVTSYGWVALAYALVGLGAGIGLTPASRSLTSSVPATKAGMASGTTDLERDLGGSIMQALLGSLLTAGYATAMITQIGSSGDAASVTEQTRSALQQSYASAANLAAQYPTYASQITAAARESFLAGANWAYLAAIAAVVIGGVVVAVCLPGHKREIADLGAYAKADAGVDAKA
jgi:MFS family permease